MIDFNSKVIFKLELIENSIGKTEVDFLLLEDETIEFSFKSMRDMVIITNKRVIAINVQGITGKKKDFSSLPLNKIQAFSVETAGTLDLDSELELWFSGLGKVKFEFSRTVDIRSIGTFISGHLLNN
jgi:hypothetical protein